MSLLELLSYLEELAGHPIALRVLTGAPVTRKSSIANCTRVREELGWSPKVAPKDGVGQLWAWTHPNRALLEKVLG